MPVAFPLGAATAADGGGIQRFTARHNHTRLQPREVRRNQSAPTLKKERLKRTASPSPLRQDELSLLPRELRMRARRGET